MRERRKKRQYSRTQMHSPTKRQHYKKEKGLPKSERNVIKGNMEKERKKELGKLHI